MARIDTPTYTDDLAALLALTLAEGEVKPGTLTEKQHVTIRLTQGKHTYTVDTKESNPLAAYLRSNGLKQGKKGAKPKGEGEPSEAASEAPAA